MHYRRRFWRRANGPWAAICCTHMEIFPVHGTCPRVSTQPPRWTANLPDGPALLPDHLICPPTGSILTFMCVWSVQEAEPLGEHAECLHEWDSVSDGLGSEHRLRRRRHHIQLDLGVKRDPKVRRRLIFHMINAPRLLFLFIVFVCQCCAIFRMLLFAANAITPYDWIASSSRPRMLSSSRAVWQVRDVRVTWSQNGISTTLTKESWHRHLSPSPLQFIRKKKGTCTHFVAIQTNVLGTKKTLIITFRLQPLIHALL